MTRSRGLLVAILCAVLALGGMGGLLLVKQSDTDLGVRLAACVPDSKRDLSIPPSVEQDDCLTEVITYAVVQDRVGEILPELDRLNAIGPQYCHLAAHSAVALAWPARDDDWQQLIDRVNVPNCNSGLLHGLFDAAATKGWDVEEWRPLTKWCDLQESGFDHANCGDAVGHAAWLAYGDRETAAKLCMQLTKRDWVVECGDGIVMQEFDPAKRDGRLLVDLSTMFSVCTHVPVDDTTGLREGCLRGVGYVIAERFVVPGSTGPIPPREKLEAAILKSQSYCAVFGDQQVHCVDRFLSLIPYHFMGFPDDPEPYVCRPQTEFMRNCRANFAIAKAMVQLPGSPAPTGKVPDMAELFGKSDDAPPRSDPRPRDDS